MQKESYFQTSPHPVDSVSVGVISGMISFGKLEIDAQSRKQNDRGRKQPRTERSCD